MVKVGLDWIHSRSLEKPTLRSFLALFLGKCWCYMGDPWGTEKLMTCPRLHSCLEASGIWVWYLYSFHILRWQKNQVSYIVGGNSNVSMSRVVGSNFKNPPTSLAIDSDQSSWRSLGPSTRGVISIPGMTGKWSNLCLCIDGNVRKWGIVGEVLQLTSKE